MFVLFIKMSFPDAFFGKNIYNDLLDSDEEEGCKTPDEEISLTPIGSPTKYKEDHTDVLTKFFIDDAAGLVDKIERLSRSKQKETNCDYKEYYESQIDEAKTELFNLKFDAEDNELVEEYLFKTYNIKAGKIDDFLQKIIDELTTETRNLMDEADKAGAEAAKKRSDEEHKRRKQIAERIRKQGTNSLDHQSEPTPTCGPCIIALRL